jgi:type I restriction enzyme S subunit
MSVSAIKKSLVKRNKDSRQIATLGKLLPIKYGKSLSAQLRDPSGSYPVFGSSGIVGVHSSALTTGATLIIGRKGNVGAVHYSKVPCWPIDTTYYVEAPEGHNLRYYKYLLESLNLSRLDRSTAIPGLSRDDYNAVEVSNALPNEQDEIVAEIEKQFSRLDEAVSNLKRVKANLKRYKASVLKDAVEGRLVPTEAELARHEGRSYESGEELLRRILEARRGQWKRSSDYKTPRSKKSSVKLPEGWAWSTYEQVGRLQLGRQRAPKYHSGPNMRPYLRVQNVFEDRIDVSDVMEMDFPPSDFEKYQLFPGDLLLNEGQSPELLGRPAIYRGELRGACFTNTLIRFRAAEGVSVEFALHVSRHNMLSGRFVDEGTITTNIAHLSLGRLASVEFPLPPAAEQIRIVAEVERRLSLVRSVEAEVDANLKRAQSLRQAVLAKSFAG